MRILLQQKKTGLYLKSVGDWTQQAAEAMDFPSSSKAIEFCVLNKVLETQLVLKFDQEHYEIVLPTANERRGIGRGYASRA